MNWFDPPASGSLNKTACSRLQFYVKRWNVGLSTIKIWFDSLIGQVSKVDHIPRLNFFDRVCSRVISSPFNPQSLSLTIFWSFERRLFLSERSDSEKAVRVTENWRGRNKIEGWRSKLGENRYDRVGRSHIFWCEIGQLASIGLLSIMCHFTSNRIGFVSITSAWIEKWCRFMLYESRQNMIKMK
jgi:hypothetical protein